MDEPLAAPAAATRASEPRCAAGSGAGRRAEPEAAAVRLPQPLWGDPLCAQQPREPRGILPWGTRGFYTSGPQPEPHVEFIRAPRKDNVADPRRGQRARGSRFCRALGDAGRAVTALGDAARGVRAAGPDDVLPQGRS